MTSPIITKNKAVLLLSGEISSDSYGATLAQTLTYIAPELKIHAAGGDKLKLIADVFVYESAYKSPLGLRSFQQQRFRRSFFRAMVHYLETYQPAVCVIVDFQHLHPTIIRLLRQKNVPIVTYITPNSWLWKNEKVAQRIAAYSRDIITIFEPEYLFYKKFSQRVHYFGHPLPFVIDPKIMTYKKPYQSGFPLVSLWPGSREDEITRLLPKMLDTVRVLDNKQLGHHFAIAVTDGRFVSHIRKLVAKKVPDIPILIWEGDKDKLLRESTLAITASGTMTLHLLLYRVPMVILGALSPLSYLVARYGLRIQIKYIGLPNILSHYPLVPEFIQGNIVPRDVASGLISLQQAPQKETLLSGYETLIKQIFPEQNPFPKLAKLLLGEL